MTQTTHFAKSNPIPQSDSLICEVEGLRLLGKYKHEHGFQIPKIISESRDVIELERIVEVAPRQEQWRVAGKALAKLHRISCPEISCSEMDETESKKSFGFHRDNYIGLSPQENKWNSNWGDFFFQSRLRFQCQMIQEASIRKEFISILERRKMRIIEFLNSHSPIPSLVHGDLWSGNIMFSENGPWLIDPAVYYGDREVDVAMTKMFGGFSPDFYRAYQEEWKLSDRFEERREIYNLYQYLNHYNLFGYSYLSKARFGLEIIAAL